MKRRTLVGAGIGVVTHRAVRAQGGIGPMRRIGFLSESWAYDPTTATPWGLAALWWVMHRDYVLDFKYAQGRRDRLDALAAELVAAKPDVLVGMLNPEILALKRATTSIPIVMLYAMLPVELGIVQSLARPGGNITGTTTNPLWVGGQSQYSPALPGAGRRVPAHR